jgi:hypothetical protein
VFAANRHKRPLVANSGPVCEARNVRLLHAAERPDFVALNAAAIEIAHLLIGERRAAGPDIDHKADEYYFLGTIVLIDRPGEAPFIVDGQQRIATTTILLARIRDYLTSINRTSAAPFIEETFLSNIDIKTENRVSRVKMNLEDNHFFSAQILPKILPGQAKTQKKKDEVTLRPSNRRLARASDMTAEFVGDVVKHLPAYAQADHLIKWVDFIDDLATVLVVTVPDDVSAFRMFETLNDRGLKAVANFAPHHLSFTKARSGFG